MQNVAHYLSRWLAKKRAVLCLAAAENVTRMAGRWRRMVGDVLPAALGPEQVEAVERGAAEGRAGASVNQERTYFCAFMRYLRDWGVLTGSPEAVWRSRKAVRKRRPVRISADELKHICAQLPDDLVRFVRFAAATGMREGTIRRLAWEMLGPDGVIRVPAEMQKDRRPLTIPLGADALGALGPRVGSGLMFPGLPDARRLYRAFKGAVNRAGVDPATKVHDLRVTFLGRMLDAGAPAPVIMQLGGWASQAMITRHYFVPVGPEAARLYLERAQMPQSSGSNSVSSSSSSGGRPSVGAGMGAVEKENVEAGVDLVEPLVLLEQGRFDRVQPATDRAEGCAGREQGGDES